jgi:hypothetical protein
MGQSSGCRERSANTSLLPGTRPREAKWGLVDASREAPLRPQYDEQDDDQREDNHKKGRETRPR